MLHVINTHLKGIQSYWTTHSRRINCTSTFEKYIHFYLFLFFWYINSKLNQIADFYSKIQINIYITEGRVTWHMYEFCNFIWIYSRFLLLIILKDYWHQILHLSVRVLHSESKRENVADCLRPVWLFLSVCSCK